MNAIFVRMICNAVQCFKIGMPSIHIKHIVGIYLKENFGTFTEAINTALFHTGSYTYVSYSDGGDKHNILNWPWERGIQMVREGDIALKLQIHVQRSWSIFSHCQTILFNCCEFCRIDVFFLQQCRWNCTKSQYFALVKHTCCTDIIFYGFVSKFCQQFPNSEHCHKVPISCPTKLQNTVVI